MKMKTNIVFCIACSITLLSLNWPSKLKTKIEKTVLSTYSIDTFDLDKVELSNIPEELSTKIKNESLFLVNSKDHQLGYIYVSQAPSMKNVFDYIVLFDNEWKIVNTKVLIYRETHGKQIGSKRWLSQFIGMHPTDRPILGDDIDGITGATISVNGMTTAVHDLLEAIDHLRNKGAL